MSECECAFCIVHISGEMKIIDGICASWHTNGECKQVGHQQLHGMRMIPQLMIQLLFTWYARALYLYIYKRAGSNRPTIIELVLQLHTARLHFATF